MQIEFLRGLVCGAGLVVGSTLLTIALHGVLCGWRERSQREAARRRLGTLEGNTGYDL